VDRSAAYATRHIAVNLVAAGVCDEVLVQVAYAIGKPDPTNIYVNTYGTSKVKHNDIEIGKVVEKLFNMRPYHIEQRLKLRNPIYQITAAYGHMGREPQVLKNVKFKNGSGEEVVKDLELFTWEKTDMVDAIKKALF